MKVLLLSYGKAPVRYKYISNYCENFWSPVPGYEVITFGYSEGVDILIRPEDEFGKVVEALPRAWVPDFCLLREVEWNLLPKGIEEAPFPVVTLTFDWDYDVPLAKIIVDSSDLIISVSAREKELLQLLGAHEIEVINPMGVMREFIDPQPKKMKDRKYDILYTTFIDDISHLDRSRLILKLCRLSDKYNIYIPDQVRDYETYIELLRESKLVLSHHRHGSMSGRIFEAGGQGTVVIETGEEVQRYFTPYEEYIPVSNNDFFQQIEKYLNDERLLQLISDRVYLKVKKNFEARKRFIELLDFIYLLIKEKGRSLKRKKKSEYERFIQRGTVYYYQFFRGVSGEGFLDLSAKDFLKLSIHEFEKAVNVERSPRSITNLALTKSSWSFLFDTREEFEQKAKNLILLLKDAINLCPEYIPAHFNIGVLQFRTKNYDEMLSTFNLTLGILARRKAHIDVYALHMRDFDLLNQLIHKPLNILTLEYYKNRDHEVLRRIGDLFGACMLFFMGLAEEEKGDLYAALCWLKESLKLYRGSGLVTMKAADLLALLGYKGESVEMYERALELLPLNTKLMCDYVRLLHIYGMCYKAMEIARNALRIVDTVDHLKHEKQAVKNVMEGLACGVMNEGFPYHYHRELTLNKWIDRLYVGLRKAPSNFRLIIRLVEIFRELNRQDKIIEIIQEYISRYLRQGCSNHEWLVLRNIYEELETNFNHRKKVFANIFTKEKARELHSNVN